MVGSNTICVADQSEVPLLGLFFGNSDKNPGAFSKSTGGIGLVHGHPLGTIGGDMKKRNRIHQIISALTLFLGMVTLSRTGYAASAFPSASMARESQDILNKYQVYLDFVIQVGRKVDLASTQRMESKFLELRKRNPEGAARFLKGLRFEMVDKAQRMGRQEGALNTQNPELIRWVGRFMNHWAREADEHLYRVYSSQLAKK